MLGEQFAQVLVGAHRTSGRSSARTLHSGGTGEFLHLAYAQLAGHDALVQLHLLGGVGDGDQRARMAHADGPLAQTQLDLGRQTQQAQVVRDGGAVLPHLFAQLLLGQFHFIHQPLEADGHLDGVELLALDVLHERHLQHGLVVGDAHIGRHFLQPRQLRGAEPPLTADELVAVVTHLAQGHRLDHAQFLDALRQFQQRLFTEVGARLEGVCLDLRDGHHADRA